MISIQTVTDNILAEFAGGIADADGLAADKPPSMINLADCFNAGHCPPNDLAEAETRLRDLALLRGEWHLPGLPLRTKRFAPDGALILEVGQLFEQLSDPPPDELAQYATPQDGDRVYGERQIGVGVAPLTVSLVGIYEHWEDTASNARPGFPLTPLIRAWFSRPTDVRLNIRKTARIIPGPLAMVDHDHSKAGKLFAYAAHKSPDGQLTLPGFDRPRTGPALPLELYRLGIGNAANKGGYAAPLAKRLFIEGLLAVRTEDRHGNGLVSVPLTLKELLARLYPGESTPRPNEYLPKLAEAIEIEVDPENWTGS